MNIHENLIKITRVALLLNCSPATIKRWYKWAEKSGLSREQAKLPDFEVDARGTWYFKMEQVQQLKEFRKNLKWGQMAEFNAKYYWSKKERRN